MGQDKQLVPTVAHLLVPAGGRVTCEYLLWAG